MSKNEPPLSALPPGDDATVEREMGQRSRRAFIVGLAAAATGYVGYRWVKSRPEIDGVPGPLRRTLSFNESVTRKVFDPNQRIKEFPASAKSPGGLRQNGDVGLDEEMDVAAWRLRIKGTDLALTLADLKTLPEVNQITPLRCIEGWTSVAQFTGVRMADFTDKFFPPGRQFPFLGLTTPKGDYYVGLDAPSAFHPQTLLCYAINGAPLSLDHGAPLRLLIPTKYGVKNLKRIGEIDFTHTQPADYWAEQGYDWYAGL